MHLEVAAACLILGGCKCFNPSFYLDASGSGIKSGFSNTSFSFNPSFYLDASGSREARIISPGIESFNPSFYLDASGRQTSQ